MHSRRLSKADLTLAPARYVHRASVRFSEVDLAGIVYFTRVLEYFFDAHLAFRAAHGIPIAKPGAASYVTSVSHAEADYLRMLRYDDAIEIAVVGAFIEGGALTVGYRITRSGESQAAAVGQTVHAFAETKGGPPTPVPAEVARVFSPLFL